MKIDFDSLFLSCPSDSEVVHGCCLNKYKSIMHRTITSQKFLYLHPSASFGSLYLCRPAHTSGPWWQVKKRLNKLLAPLWFFKEENSQLLGLDAAPMLMRSSCTPALGQDQAGQRVTEEQGKGNRGRKTTFSLSSFPLSS